MHHLAELLTRNALFFLTLLLEKTRLFHHVARAEKQHAFTRQAIAPGPSRFLVIALDVLWQIVMDHKSHVRFIDSHAERDRRRDHARVVTEQLILMPCSL